MTSCSNLAKTSGVLGAVIVCLTFSSIASATNGLFGHAYGVRQAGIAGSGVAFPQDPLIAAINPSGVAYVGRRNEIGVALFSPMRSYEVTGVSPPPPNGFPPFAGPKVDSDSEFFVVPDLGFAWPIDDQSSFGLAIYGNGGMNTDWPAADTPFGAGTFGAAAVPGATIDAGVDYAQLFTNFTYARKFADGRASWGVSALINYSRIEMKGLAAFAPFSLDPARLTDQGHDSAFGFGAKIGIQGDIANGVTLAASYQSKIKNEFDDYAGLFPNGGELDIPPVLQAGVAADVGPGKLTFDVQYIFYEDSDGIGNTSLILPTQCVPSRPFTPNPVASGDGCLGGKLGFGWEDMTVFKAGYTWKAGNGWTWRVGGSIGDNPVKEEEVTLNIIAPGVIEDHITFGFSKALSGKKEFSLAFMYAPENCVAGPDLFTPGKQVELCMDQYQLNAGFSF
jgi:long-chain fatty acid transport protein